MSSISITGSIVDADGLSEAREARTAFSPSTIDRLHRELSRDTPAGPELGSAVDFPSASSAGPGVIGLSPALDNVVPLRAAAVEKPLLSRRGGLVEVAGAASGNSITGSVIDRADRLNDVRESRTPVALSTIDSLLRDLSRDPPADTRLAAQLRSALEAASASAAGPGVIALSPGPSSVAPVADAPALRPASAEDQVLKELGSVLARLDAAKAPKRRFFR